MHGDFSFSTYFHSLELVRKHHFIAYQIKLFL